MEIPKRLITAKIKICIVTILGVLPLAIREADINNFIVSLILKRNKLNISAKVDAICYDPNRTCHIALLAYLDGDKSFILAPQGLKVGDVVVSSDDADIKVGNSKQLKDIPIGTLVHNVEMYPGAGGQMAVRLVLMFK